jgi:hypothetical protein
MPPWLGPVESKEKEVLRGVVRLGAGSGSARASNPSHFRTRTRQVGWLGHALLVPLHGMKAHISRKQLLDSWRRLSPVVTGPPLRRGDALHRLFGRATLSPPEGGLFFCHMKAVRFPMGGREDVRKCALQSSLLHWERSQPSPASNLAYWWIRQRKN